MIGVYAFVPKGKLNPMYIGHSESTINPEYNPMDPDIPLKAALSHAETKEEKDSIKESLNKILA